MPDVYRTEEDTISPVERKLIELDAKVETVEAQRWDNLPETRRKAIAEGVLSYLIDQTVGVASSPQWVSSTGFTEARVSDIRTKVPELRTLEVFKELERVPEAMPEHSRWEVTYLEEAVDRDLYSARKFTEKSYRLRRVRPKPATPKQNFVKAYVTRNLDVAAALVAGLFVVSIVFAVVSR